MSNDGIKIGEPRNDLIHISHSGLLIFLLPLHFVFHKSLQFHGQPACSILFIFKTYMDLTNHFPTTQIPYLTASYILELIVRYRILQYLRDDGAGSGGPRYYRSAEARPRLQEGRSSQEPSGRGTVIGEYRFE